MAPRNLRQPGLALILALLVVSTLVAGCDWTDEVDWNLLTLPTITPGERSPTPAPLTQATLEAAPNPFDAHPTPVPSLQVTLPLERLAILEPGPGSFVRTGFQVVGRGGPTRDGKIRVRLFGEDGSILTRRTAYLVVPPGQVGRFYDTIPFRITLAAEAGRLEVSSYDRKDGQIDHVTTADLTLLSIGSPLIHPTARETEELAILSPQEEATVRNGTAHVRGAAEVGSRLPLIIEVRDSRGELVGSLQIPTETTPLGHILSFDVEVPFRVSQRQLGHVGVRQMSDGIPGTVHYNSIRVWLEP